MSAVSTAVNAWPTSATVPQLSYGFSAGQVTLGWPANHIGWRLLAQTNSTGSGLGTN